jgi:hypothetical protein
MGKARSFLAGGCRKALEFQGFPAAVSFCPEKET